MSVFSLRRIWKMQSTRTEASDTTTAVGLGDEPEMSTEVHTMVARSMPTVNTFVRDFRAEAAPRTGASCTRRLESEVH
jgi:hypothetical protein